MKKLGYREMLRDRCPKIVSLALKWQKAKERWIDHAYRYFIKIVGDEIDVNNNIIRKSSENKRRIMNILLGLKKGKPINFKFDDTIDWDNLTDEEKVYWKRVSSWVKWFSTNYAYIENVYEISKKTGKNDSDIRLEIIRSFMMNLMPDSSKTDEEKEAQYAYIDNLLEFLINSFEGKYERKK